MQVPGEVLAEFRARGLLVSQEPFPPYHAAYPDGVCVIKPVGVPGNSAPGWKTLWGYPGVPCDSPSLVLHRADGQWVVSSEDYEPGPGPGDFVHRWDTAAAAVADILDFYFGDPARMLRKR